MLLPLLLVISQVSGEGLLAPGAVDGVGDGRKGGHRLVLAGVAEELFTGRLVQSLSLNINLTKRLYIDVQHTKVRAP